MSCQKFLRVARFKFVLGNFQNKEMGNRASKCKEPPRARTRKKRSVHPICPILARSSAVEIFKFCIDQWRRRSRINNRLVLARGQIQVPTWILSYLLVYLKQESGECDKIRSTVISLIRILETKSVQERRRHFYSMMGGNHDASIGSIGTLTRLPSLGGSF